MSKVCQSCKQNKPDTDFGSAGPQRGGLYSWCKVCKAIRRRAAWKARPRHEKQHITRNSGLWKAYRIRQADYDRMLSEQDGVCALCGRPPTQKGKSDIPRLVVDHNHTTRQVRALLCSECNIGLGKFQESPELLLKAVAYLKKHL